jgi:hypothetical protein
MPARKLSDAAIRAASDRMRGPLTMAMVRKQNKQVTTRAQAIRVLYDAGIVTRAGHLRARFK